MLMSGRRRWGVWNRAEGGEGGRGERFHPRKGAETCNQQATTPQTRCANTNLGGRPAPAAGLEPATQRLTAACSTN